MSRLGVAVDASLDWVNYVLQSVNVLFGFCTVPDSYAVCRAASTSACGRLRFFSCLIENMDLLGYGAYVDVPSTWSGAKEPQRKSNIRYITVVWLAVFKVLYSPTHFVLVSWPVKYLNNSCSIKSALSLNCWMPWKTFKCWSKSNESWVSSWWLQRDA